MATAPEDDTLELPPVPTFGHGRPRWAAHRIHPRRISIGHLKLYGRLRGWARAENHATRGKAIATRASGLALGALMAWRTANDQPRLLALAAGAYVVAAWRAGRPVPPTPEELQRRFLLGVQELIGDRPGIHLRQLYDELQARPAAAHLDDARLRALLVHCQVPIHKSLRIGETTGRSGIKAADIQALLSPPETKEQPCPDETPAKPAPTTPGGP
ncbi:hypothetical protein Q5762_13875 [Streptomyces sp. P9(2023)]|uniref:hypothetical protein n=1 Tax=Streptomyces sp. P9(2023) TaxID=3064394 RepID=UPI0028F43A16|nr:hypothetical protein [Streptomyces sp. P9(2023)]MDT9689405.1 hypothetical protein [Streptomyces sp. P9(2023)]